MEKYSLFFLLYRLISDVIETRNIVFPAGFYDPNIF